MTRYIDELGSADDDDAFAQGAAPPIACIIEELRGGMGSDDLVHFGFVAVTPATGDIVYDTFDGKCMTGHRPEHHSLVQQILICAPKLRYEYIIPD
jgi:hypothetical protein